VSVKVYEGDRISDILENLKRQYKLNKASLEHVEDVIRDRLGDRILD